MRVRVFMAATLRTRRRPAIGAEPDSISYSGRRRGGRGSDTFGRMRRHWLDLLIILAALEGALEVLLRSDAPDAPTLAPGLAAVAVALLVLPLLGRRRSPFAA